MNQEEIKKALEAIGKGGIHVAGDFVMEKHVEHEVANVEAGGIGIQIINGEKNSQSVSDKKELSKEQLASAIENCQQFFWANASYAVVFCICRDEYKIKMSKSDFETMIEDLPYTRKRSYTCPTGTIANAFSDNPIYADPISEWDNRASKRIIKLRDELLSELKL